MSPKLGRKHPRSESVNEALKQESTHPQKRTTSIKIEETLNLEALTRDELIRRIKNLETLWAREKGLSEDLAEERSISKQVNSEMSEEVNGLRNEQAQSEVEIEGLMKDVVRLEVKVTRAEATIVKLMREAERDKRDASVPITTRRWRRLGEDSSDSEDDDHVTAVADLDDCVDRCPLCGWEVEDGQCADLVRCGKMVKESGDVSTIAALE